MWSGTMSNWFEESWCLNEGFRPTQSAGNWSLWKSISGEKNQRSRQRSPVCYEGQFYYDLIINLLFNLFFLGFEKGQYSTKEEDH